MADKPKFKYYTKIPLARNKTRYFYSEAEDMAAVNPYYDTGMYEYTHNCALSTIAYDLRKRGYDVQAGAKSADDMYNTFTLALMYKDSDVRETTSLSYGFTESTSNNNASTKPALQKYRYASVDSPEFADRLEKELSSYGDGARGQLGLQWSAGGGHSCIWEIQNGKVVIIDAQTNEKVSLYDYTSRADKVDYFRMDNLEINDGVLEMVANREEERERRR